MSHSGEVGVSGLSGRIGVYTCCWAWMLDDSPVVIITLVCAEWRWLITSSIISLINCHWFVSVLVDVICAHEKPNSFVAEVEMSWTRLQAHYRSLSPFAAGTRLLRKLMNYLAWKIIWPEIEILRSGRNNPRNTKCYSANEVQIKQMFWNGRILGWEL